MIQKTSLKEEILQKIKRLEEAYNEFSQKIELLRMELEKITKEILKRIEEEKISKVKK